MVVSATDAGVLQVYRLINIAADRFEPPELQHARLEEALRANIMKAALAVVEGSSASHQSESWSGAIVQPVLSRFPCLVFGAV